MSEIRRICAQCGAEGPVEARYCPHCGYDAQAALPVPSSSLPVVLGKAALPVVVGVASLALRAGWKLLQNRLAQEAATVAAAPTNVQDGRAQATEIQPISARPRRTIRIRSSWTVGDGRGTWKQGVSEHTIEFDD